MLSSRHFFITGTDTDVGKTLIGCGLLVAAANKGLRTLAVKPIAAGADSTPEGLRNQDAVMLMEAMTEKMSYQQVNPVLLEPPIAPHIAAEQVGRRVSVAQLAGLCRGAMMQSADFVLIEGAGGWRVPLNGRELLSHALLTADAIKADGLRLAGWVANRIDPDMSCFEENVSTLKALLPAPCLGVVPYLKGEKRGFDNVAKFLDVSIL